jgi:hypothetical protein
MNREGMYKQFAEKEFTRGCEVGVREGKNAELMLKLIPDLHLLLVDPYMCYVYEIRRQKRRNRWKWHQPTMDRLRQHALMRLSNRNVKWLMLTSEQAAMHVQDGSLDFVYIDGNHSYNFIMQDIILWAGKVRAGGIVSGHDYGISDVRRAVDLYVHCNHIARLNVTDRQVEKNRSKTCRSWMFEKK